MKKSPLIAFLFILPLILCLSCSGSKTAKSHLVTIDGKAMLVGEIKADELFREFPVFKENYDLYTPADSVVNFLKHFSKPVQIEIFLGTWCGDTREYLPPFLKLFDTAQNPLIKILLHAVDRTKKDPQGRADLFLIQRVPTLIFLYQNKEFARFVETPEISVEEDLIKILNQCP